MSIHTDILNSFPQVDQVAVNQLLSEEIRRCTKKIVVLDDDPTGVQTVHDVSVYTDWSKDSILSGFQEDRRVFYILTNSRGFTTEQTTAVHREIAHTISEVSRQTNRDYILLCRSDSTLRGHYPLETAILKEEIEQEEHSQIDGEVLCPFFKEGGRFTINNIHYVKYGEELIPAGETEFAKDKTFGYSSSDLRDYVEEKTEGAFKNTSVTCISLEVLRQMDFANIEHQLMGVSQFGKIIVNAVDYADLKIFCIALYRVMAKGKRFLFRTAAALVKVIAGITDQPLLTRSDMITSDTGFGGIVVVGSHTQKTTSQLEALKSLECLEFIEFNSDLVLSETAFVQEIKRVIQLEEASIAAGRTAVVYTKRKLLVVEQDTKEDALLRSVKISDAVQSLVGRLTVTPGFVVAKGGITSSDIGTKALGVKKARVMGQIKPGIPVWQTGAESKFPNTPYVIFPGNVGEVTTLKEAVEILLYDTKGQTAE